MTIPPIARLLLHLPSTKNSARRFLVPIFGQPQVKLCVEENEQRPINNNARGQFVGAASSNNNDKELISNGKQSTTIIEEGGVDIIRRAMLSQNRQQIGVRSVPWTRSNLAWNSVEIRSTLPNHEFIERFYGVLLDDSSNNSDLFHSMTEWPKDGSDSSHKTRRRTLQDLILEKKKIDLSWLTQIASAMVHVHAHEIILARLRPQDVLFSTFEPEQQHEKEDPSKATSTKNARCLISNFDHARHLKDNGSFLPSISLDLLLQQDKDFSILAFCAPEILAQKPINRMADVYSFGVLMYNLVHACSSENSSKEKFLTFEQQIMYQHQLSKETFCKKVVEEGFRPKWTFPDPNLKRLAERCLSFEPDARPEFEEVFAALQRDYPVVHDSNKVNLPWKVQERIHRVGTNASIGHVRRTMEDSLAVLETTSSNKKQYVCAVFDGLRNSRTAEFAAKYFSLKACQELMKSNEQATRNREERKAILQKSLKATDDALQLVVPEIECGSTATVTLVDDEGIDVGWLGDSSAYLFRRQPPAVPSASSSNISPPSSTVGGGGMMHPHYQATAMIKKHAPNRPDELARIDAANGVVLRETMHMPNGEKRPIGPWRAYQQIKSKEEEGLPRMGIAISRALGLFEFRPVISGEAEFVDLQRQKDKDMFLILASDGLWDLLDLKQVLHIVLESRGDPQTAADALVKRVLDLGAHDNVSVIILKLDEDQPIANKTNNNNNKETLNNNKQQVNP